MSPPRLWAWGRGPWVEEGVLLTGEDIPSGSSLSGKGIESLDQHRVKGFGQVTNGANIR